jgi:hypothetical protein
MAPMKGAKCHATIRFRQHRLGLNRLTAVQIHRRAGQIEPTFGRRGRALPQDLRVTERLALTAAIPTLAVERHAENGLARGEAAAPPVVVDLLRRFVDRRRLHGLRRRADTCRAAAARQPRRNLRHDRSRRRFETRQQPQHLERAFPRHTATRAADRTAPGWPKSSLSAALVNGALSRH